MSKKIPSRNGFTYLLFALMLLSSLYSYKKHEDYSKLETVFSEEKEDLKSELDELIEDYKDLNVQKKGLSKRLIREMNKIIALRDTVSKLKASNYRLIRKYRRKIATLERENRDLFAKVDSLNVINSYLKQQNTIVAQRLEEKSTITQKLAKTNRKLKRRKSALEAKVAVAGRLKISEISATPMKERSSGKFTATTRYNKTDAFRVNFSLLENDITAAGKKKVYIQIVDSDNKIVASKGRIRLKNKKRMRYSDRIVADYQNEDMPLLSLIFVNRDDIKQGKYLVNVYVEGKYAGQTKIYFE